MNVLIIPESFAWRSHLVCSLRYVFVALCPTKRSRCAPRPPYWRSAVLGLRQTAPEYMKRRGFGYAWTLGERPRGLNGRTAAIRGRRLFLPFPSAYHIPSSSIKEIRLEYFLKNYLKSNFQTFIYWPATSK